eukprot:752497-Hanusia_phi.AAC.2
MHSLHERQHILKALYLERACACRFTRAVHRVEDRVAVWTTPEWHTLFDMDYPTPASFPHNRRAWKKEGFGEDEVYGRMAGDGREFHRDTESLLG